MGSTGGIGVVLLADHDEGVVGDFSLVDGLFGGNHLLWCVAEVYCAAFVGFWVGAPGGGFAEQVVDFVDAGSFGNGVYGVSGYFLVYLPGGV